MSINRFMAPVKDQYQQTYVDQYVPLPFELMQKRAEGEQKKFDAAQNNWDVLQNKMGEQLLDADTPIMAEKLDGIRSNITDALNEAGGDFRQVSRMITNAGGDYNKFIKAGEGALAKTQKAKYATNQQIINASNMSGEDKADSIKFMYDDYAAPGQDGGPGGIRAGRTIGEATTYDMKGFVKGVNDMVFKMKGDSTEDAYATIDDKTGLKLTGSDSKTFLTDKRIEQLSQFAKSDPDFQSFIDVRWNLENRRGEIPAGITNKEDFAEYKFAQMIDPLQANAYLQKKQDRNLAETEKSKAKTARAKKWKPTTPKVMHAFSQKVEANADFYKGSGEDRGLINEEDVTTTILGKNEVAGRNLLVGDPADGADNSKSLQGLFLAALPENAYATTALEKEAFDTKFKDLMKRGGFTDDVENISPDDYNEFLEWSANTDDTKELATFFGGEPKMVQTFQNYAKNEWKNVQRRTQLINETDAEIIKTGLISKPEVEKLKTARSTSEFDKDQLALEVKRYADKRFKDDPDMAVDFSEIVVDGDPTFITAGGANAKAKNTMVEIEKYNKWKASGQPMPEYVSTSSATYNANWNDPEFQKMADAYAKSRASDKAYQDSIDNSDLLIQQRNKSIYAKLKEPSLEIPTTNQLNVVYKDQDGKPHNGIISRDVLYKDYIDNSRGVILSSKLKNSNNKEGTIQAYINGNVTGDTSAQQLASKKALEEKILKSAEFTAVRNPQSGQQEIVFTAGSTKFRMPVEFGGRGGTGVLGLPDIQLTKGQNNIMQIQGDIYAAQKGQLKRAPVGDADLGVSIRTIKGSSTNLTFEKSLGAGGNYELNVDPRKLGIYLPGPTRNSVRDNVTIPNSDAAGVLLRYNNILSGNITNEQRKMLTGSTNKDKAKQYMRAVVAQYQGMNAIPEAQTQSQYDIQQEKDKRSAYDKKKEAEALLNQDVQTPDSTAATPDSTVAQPIPEIMSTDSINNVEPSYTPEEVQKKTELRAQAKERARAQQKKKVEAEKVILDSNSTTEEKKATIQKTLGDDEAPTKHKVDLIKKAMGADNHNPLEFANKYLGTDENNKEHQAAIKGFMDAATPGWVKNTSDVTMNRNAWCAAFMNHVLNEGGWKSVDTGNKYDRIRAAQYANLGDGVKTENKKPGDIVFIKNKETGQDHIAFYAGEKDGKMLLLGGNQGNKVSVMEFNDTTHNLMDIRRLKNVSNIKDADLLAIQSTEHFRKAEKKSSTR